MRHGMAPQSVTQEWTHSLSFMMQTVLLTAIRGPDGCPKYGSAKYLLRWFRRCTLVSSLDGCVIDNPWDNTKGGSFMGPSYDADLGTDCWERPLNAMLSGYLRELDAIPAHFQHHLRHAFEIVGYKHPDARIAAWFQEAYFRLVNDMHLYPETEAELDRRLGDNKDQWLERADPATVA